MIGWRIGALIIAGLLAVVAGAGLVDGISNRATIAELRRGNGKLSEWLGDAQRNVGTCGANVVTLGAALDRQSAQIGALANASKTAGELAAAAAIKGAADARRARDAAEAVLKLPRPAPADACRAAVQLLRGAK